VVRTTLWIWFGLHVAFAIGAGGPSALSPAVAGTLLVLTVVMSHLDRASRGLNLFLANLGFSGRRLALLVVGVAGAAEAVAQTIQRLLT
jgi:hypothetical protein